MYEKKSKIYEFDFIFFLKKKNTFYSFLKYYKVGYKSCVKTV